jgi:hypothetical protein
MSSVELLPLNPLPVELGDWQPSADQLLRVAWLELFGYMKDICDALNRGEGLYGWLYLPDDSRLSCERTSETEHRIVYHVGRTHYVMQLNADLDLGYIELRFDPCPYVFQYRLAVHGQQAYFCNCDQVPPAGDTMEEAARSLLFEFLMLDDLLS